MPTLERPEVSYRTPVDLVSDVRRGRIRIPLFQRGFKWESGDVIDLFDSLIRGFPIGNLLLWLQPAPAAQLHVGPVEVDAPATDSALWVVDGQQRITSIVGALIAADEATDPRFRIYLDLDEGSFHSAGVRQEPAASWVAVSQLLDTASLLRWMRENAAWLSDQQIAVADRAAKAIREYQIPTYVVSSPDETSLVEIFRRMNDTGKPLTKAEVFHALNAGLAGIPHIRLLPYSHVLPVLVRFIRVQGAPSGRAAVLLRRWVWRGAIAGTRARGISVVDIRNQVSAAEAAEPVAAAQRLLGQVPSFPDVGAELDKVHFNHAMTKINVLGLLSAGPRDLKTGQPVEVVRLLEGGSPLRPIANDTRVRRSNSLANRAVTDLGSGRTLQYALAAAGPDVAASHVVDAEAQFLLATGRLEDFIARREPAVGALVKGHIDRMAEWGARDGRSVADIIRSVA